MWLQMSWLVMELFLFHLWKMHNYSISKILLHLYIHMFILGKW